MAVDGYLEVGTNGRGEVVINLDHVRTGHIVFSPEQAIALAGLLLNKACAAKEKLPAPQSPAQEPKT